MNETYKVMNAGKEESYRTKIFNEAFNGIFITDDIIYIKIDGDNTTVNEKNSLMIKYDGETLDLKSKKWVDYKKKGKKVKPNVETKENNEANLSEIAEYFGIDENELNTLNEKIVENGLGLNIGNFLLTYKNYIKNNLEGKLNEGIIKKIIKSVGLRIYNLSEIIDERISFVDEQIEEGDYKINKTKTGYKTIEEVRKSEIKNERWIIDSYLKDSFSFIDKKLLPSTKLLIKYNEQKLVRDKEFSFDFSNKIEEINKMFNSDLLENGDFDKTWRSGELVDANTNSWDIFDMNIEQDKHFIKGQGVKTIEGATLLNSKDIEIKNNAEKWFMIAIAAQITIEVGPAVAASVVPVAGTIAGAFVGAAAGGTIDVADIFSDTEVLLDIVQGAGLVDPNYRMEKTWIDNILAGIGIIPGTTVAIKGKKLTEFLSKIPSEELESGINTMKNLFLLKIGFKNSDNFLESIKGNKLEGTIYKGENGTEYIATEKGVFTKDGKLQETLTEDFLKNNEKFKEISKEKINIEKHNFLESIKGKKIEDLSEEQLGKLSMYKKEELSKIREKNIFNGEKIFDVNDGIKMIEIENGKKLKIGEKIYTIIKKDDGQVSLYFKESKTNSGSIGITGNDINKPGTNYIQGYVVKYDGENKLFFSKDKDFINKEEIFKNSELGDTERLKEASKILNRNLDENQEKAILDAHNVGKDREGAGVYNYTQEEIGEKAKILKEAGFTKEERRILMENGIVGKSFDQTQSIEDILDILKQNGGIKGNNDFFEYEDIETIIYKYINGEVEANYITSVGGLRERIVELKREGKIMKNIENFQKHIQYTEGMELMIKRSDGRKHLAEIVNLSDKNGRIVVNWEENGQTMQKSFAPKELDKINTNGTINKVKKIEKVKQNIQYEEGMEVMIKRSDGREHLAEIVNLSDKNGRIVVNWEENGQTMQKSFAVKQLDKLNKNTVNNKFKKDSFTDIEHNINKNPEIIGADNSIEFMNSVKKYETEEGIKISAGSDKGIGYGKKNNEDRVVIDPKNEFVSAIDGVGGGLDGDKAADILAEQLLKYPNDTNKATREASQIISERLGNEPGAAFISAKVRRENGKIFIDQYHSGDCQVIILNKEGKVKYISEDHSVVNISVLEGEITRDQALYNPDRNQITRYVHGDYRKPTYKEIEVEKGDRVMLMTDGISDNLTPEELALLSKGKSIDSSMYLIDKVVSDRMNNSDIIAEEVYNGSRESNGIFSDGYLSQAKRDNRGLIIMDI